MKHHSVQESDSVCTNARVNGILHNRLAILAPNSCAGPAFCIRLCLLAQALPLGEFGVKEDQAAVAALLDFADNGVN